MFENKKAVSPQEGRTIAKYCGVKGCNNFATVYIKQHDVSRCPECYLKDIDRVKKSASMGVKKILDEEIKNAGA